MIRVKNKTFEAGQLMCSLEIMKKLKFILPLKMWSDMTDIIVIMNYGYNGYKGYNSYKGYNRYNGYNGYKGLC